MIEKRAAVENLESILRVPGIDMVQFGPSDYGLSVGKPGRGYATGLHPEVRLVTANFTPLKSSMVLSGFARV